MLGKQRYLLIPAIALLHLYMLAATPFHQCLKNGSYHLLNVSAPHILIEFYAL